MHYTTPHHTTLHYTTATLQLQLHYFTLHYTTLHYIALHCIALHITLITPPQMQLQLHYTNYNTHNYNSTTLQLQLQLHYTTLHPAVVGEVTTAGDHCNHCHSKKHNSNHLSVHQWIRSAIRDSQQPTSPIGSLFLKLPPPPCAVLLAMILNGFLISGYSMKLTWIIFNDG